MSSREPWLLGLGRAMVLAAPRRRALVPGVVDRTAATSTMLLVGVLRRDGQPRTLCRCSARHETPRTLQRFPKTDLRLVCNVSGGRRDDLRLRVNQIWSTQQSAQRQILPLLLRMTVEYKLLHHNRRSV